MHALHIAAKMTALNGVFSLASFHLYYIDLVISDFTIWPEHRLDRTSKVRI